MIYLFLKQRLKIKKKEKNEEIVKTINKVLKMSKKEEDKLKEAQNILINEFNDTTSEFHEYKNDDPNTLFFRRTCESTCCWGKTHFMNGFVLKYNKDIKSWHYYCYGEECKKKFF